MIYRNIPELLEALRLARKGQARADILAIKENRDLIKSSGANVTLYCGEKRNGNSIKEQLSSVSLGLIARLNSRTGKPDGIGALGGLSERTSYNEFMAMSPIERLQTADSRDDIIVVNGDVTLTKNINIIRIRTALRETREELGNLGISGYKLSADDIKLVEMPDIKDDNYAINIWNGEGNVWAITPYCHTLKVSDADLNILVSQSRLIHKHEPNSEAARFIKVPLFEALKCYGNFSGEKRLEDGRSAATDYRYPHEWLVSWVLASDILEHNDAHMFRLMQELQKETPWKISFKASANKIGKDLNYIADILHIQPETVLKMENIPSGNLINTAGLNR